MKYLRKAQILSLVFVVFSQNELDFEEEYELDIIFEK